MSVLVKFGKNLRKNTKNIVMKLLFLTLKLTVYSVLAFF